MGEGGACSNLEKTKVYVRRDDEEFEWERRRKSRVMSVVKRQGQVRSERRRELK